jgi:hypothetical protein
MGQAALHAFQERTEDLLGRRDALSDEAYAAAYAQLADELIAWNERAGLIPAVVHEGEECDQPAPTASPASIETHPNPSPIPTCAPCPARPSNAPPGMFRILVRESCDAFGSRTCAYRCFNIYTHGWL